ncbi:MAG: hypothetical protein EOM80_04525 [Erysipelotrichia bacterium]|nr:hypothetical protein [Erysipelotrichia bacterium]
MKMKTMLIMLLSLFACIFCSNYLAAKSLELVEPPSSPARVEIVGDERGLLYSSGYVKYSGYYPQNTVITARMGERYKIRVANLSHNRIGLVISVDGLNIISGAKSSGRPTESMYVLNGGQDGEFAGWRSGMDQVQRFYFTNRADSYAARTGDASELGWIRVAIFRERHAIIYRDYDALKSKEMPMASEQAGTGYGEGSWSPVRTTEFDPESTAAAIEVIRYEWPANIIIRPDNFAAPPPR